MTPRRPATIVRLANFYGPTSGGQRTALDEVGRRYVDAGLSPVLVVPGPIDHDEVGPVGRIVTLRSPRLRGTPYHVLADLRRLRRLLGALGPDRLELSDRATLWPAARWAADAGVPTVLWAHERLDAILAPRVPRPVPLGRLTGVWNRRTLAPVARAVAPSSFVAEELHAAGIPDVRVVPHGVDLATFHPGRRPPPSGRGVLLVWVGRLSAEKRPALALDVVAELVRRGREPRLVLVGSGAEEADLRRRAEGLPVTFTGYVARREALAHLLAAADVALATCGCESFGLAPLEALASGTPVAATEGGALGEVVGPAAGRVTAPVATALADAVEDLLGVPPPLRCRAARRRAERYDWSATVAGLLDAHDLPTGAPPTPVLARSA